jgi:hypothetical protein
VTGPNAAVVINYNPVSYAAPTNFAGFFTLSLGASVVQRMLLFPNGSRAADGTTATTLDGFNTTATSGLPVGVTLVAGPGASAVFDSAAPGSNVGITYTGYSLAGANAGQYALAGSCCVSTFRTTGTIGPAVVVPPVVVPPVVVPPVVVPPVVVPPVVVPPVVVPPVVVPPVVVPPVVVPPVTTPVVVPPPGTTPVVLAYAPPILLPVTYSPGAGLPSMVVVEQGVPVPGAQLESLLAPVPEQQLAPAPLEVQPVPVEQAPARPIVPNRPAKQDRN